MKQRLTVPALSAALGLAGFLLRLLQNRTGFEADTGLPIPGNVPSILLPILLLAAVVLLLVAARALPKGPQSFPAPLREKQPLLLTVLVLGVFLMAASGIWSILSASSAASMQYLTADGLMLMEVPTVSGTSARLMGLLAIVTAVSAFPAVAAVCREGISPLPVLAAPVCLLARLVLAYRVHSVDPVLADYYPELLSLILLILAFYRLSGFAASCGSLRFYSVYAGLTAVLSLTLLADGITPAALLALGGAALLLGFQLLLSANAAKDGEAA